MILTQEDLVHIYGCLHKVFIDDLHIARPLIQMLRQRQEDAHAFDLTIEMARRLLARGHAGVALSFLDMAKLLDHSDHDEVDALIALATVTEAGPIDMQPEAQQVFLLIDQLSDHEAMDFLQQGKRLIVEAGNEVVSQNEVSRSFYLILSGRMNVVVDAPGGRKIALSTLKAGHFFGEFACVYQLPRSATVLAEESSELLEFSDLAISQLMQRSPIAGERLMRTVQARLVHAMSHSHASLNGLQEEDRKWIADESHIVEFQDGALITRQGEMGDKWFVVVYGEAVGVCAEAGVNSIQFKVGDIFGDMDRHLRLPDKMEVHSKGRSLICSIPGEMFRSFMNAYAGFERWVLAHSEKRSKLLKGYVKDS
ncbi:MAG: cyclic nucleotide-binding domain-containing protein [Mariprofundaceae bacterium]